MSATLTNKDAYRVVFKDYPDVVNVAQMCEMLDISEKTAYRLLQENRIDHFKVGRSYKIPKLHIFSYLKVVRL